jgi:hypothetical protein
MTIVMTNLMAAGAQIVRGNVVAFRGQSTRFSATGRRTFVMWVMMFDVAADHTTLIGRPDL